MSHRGTRFVQIGLTVVLVLLGGLASGAGENEPKKARGPRRYTTRVHLHDAGPGLSVPDEQQAGVPVPVASEGAGEAAAGGSISGTIVAPAAPATRERRSRNWLVPADVFEADEDAGDGSGWGWLADDVRGAQEEPEEEAEEEPDRAGLSALRMSMRSAEHEEGEGDREIIRTGIEMTSSLRDSMDQATVSGDYDRRQQTARPEAMDEQDFVALSRLREELGGVYESPTWHGASGTYDDAGRENAMPLTQELLSGITQPLADALRPALGVPGAADAPSTEPSSPSLFDDRPTSGFGRDAAPGGAPALPSPFRSTFGGYGGAVPSGAGAGALKPYRPTGASRPLPE